jgi:hypothetical protein
MSFSYTKLGDSCQSQKNGSLTALTSNSKCALTSNSKCALTSNSKCALTSNSKCALTSNSKYILPFSRVYYKSVTPMIYYPGHESMHGVDADKLFGGEHEPEHTKAYYTKAYYIKETSIPVHSNHSRTRPVQQRRKHCTACKTRN